MPDKAAIRARLLAGLPTVFHGARADLAVQYDGDPIELVDTPPHDTQVLAYLLGEPDVHLKVLTKKLLGRDPIAYSSTLANEPYETQRAYAASDARNTYDLFLNLAPRLKEKGQDRVYAEIERPLVPIIASMEKFGSPVDTHVLLALYRDHVTVEEGLRRAIRDHYGFDVKSDDQTKLLIKSQTGFDPGTLDKRVLSRNPAGYIDLISAYRHTRTRRRAFLGRTIKRWVAAGRPEDFRLYPRYNQAGSPEGRAAPRTGRLSSADPNLMNQPHEIRSMFVGPPGYKYWSFDYKGLELCIGAALSGDEAMLRVLRDGEDGGDLHTLFQRRIFELTGKQVPRVVAKRAMFEQQYLGGADTLVRILAEERAFIDIDTAEQLVGAHARAFPQYHEAAGLWIAHGRERGYGETLFGRRRYIPELTSRDATVRGHGERACANVRIQGTAADVVKIAMRRVVPVLLRYNGHLSVQVHDELCGWVPAAVDASAFVLDMKAAMQSVEVPGITLTVTGGVGANWAEVHE